MLRFRLVAADQLHDVPKVLTLNNKFVSNERRSRRTDDWKRNERAPVRAARNFESHRLPMLFRANESSPSSGRAVSGFRVFYFRCTRSSHDLVGGVIFLFSRHPSGTDKYIPPPGRKVSAKTFQSRMRCYRYI